MYTCVCMVCVSIVVIGENDHSEVLDLVVQSDFHLEEKIVQFLFDPPPACPLSILSMDGAFLHTCPFCTYRVVLISQIIYI